MLLMDLHLFPQNIVFFKAISKSKINRIFNDEIFTGKDVGCCIKAYKRILFSLKTNMNDMMIKNKNQYSFLIFWMGFLFLRKHINITQ